MNKFLLFSISLFTTSLLAQPTIYSFVIPDKGTTDVSNSYDASSITEGNSGANVTWDFSSLISTGTFSGTYKDPSTNANSSDFPGTTILSVNSNTTAFLKATTTEWTMIGAILGSATDNYSNDPRELIKFPITYQTIFNETFSGTQDIGVAVYNRGGTIKIEGDAYGSLTMPYGTINNVLRVKITTTYSDDFMGSTIADYVDVSYQWYNGANKSFLLTWGYLDATFAGGTPIRSYIGSYLDATSVGIEDNSFVPFSFNMAPNPAKDKLSIEFDADSRENMSLEIYDMSGRNVMIKSVKNISGRITENFEISDLESGFYTVILKYNDGMLSKKLIIE